MGFKDIFKTAFPFISAAASIGGPLGTMAASAVGSALGVKVEATADSISDAIAIATTKNPDAMLKLKDAEHSFKVQMETLGFEHIEQLEEIAATDRANARAREIAVKDRIPAILAIAVTGGFFTLLGILCFAAVPAASENVLFALSGILGTAWTSVISYFFGSSAGSAAKTKILADKGEGA